MPTSEEDTPAGSGRLIAGRYRIDAKLGGGAMGKVWSGTDELLRRSVAIKEVRLPPGLPEEDAAELRERALREARAIAVITHPNVVTLYDIAREHGEPFVVMELMPSKSLAEIIGAHGPLPEAQLAAAADAIAAALEAAHRTGIIHRDVKPGNVLIDESGQIKLSDFGISRNVSEPTITRTGIMLGTPAFVAPEIASGDPVTTAADLWGLGATLFCASEGRAPYGADNDPVATITEVVQGPVPALSRSGPISDVISALMAKDPGQRIPLDEVRRRVHPILAQAGARPFGTLLGADVPTVRMRPVSAETRNPTSEQQVEPEPEPPRLASSPGPLPFMPKEPPAAPPRRSAWAMSALATAAAVVFAVASTGGFEAGRLLVTPSAQPGSKPQPMPELARTTESANHTNDRGDANFDIAVPKGWTVFHQEQDDLTNAVTVYYVSPDGDNEIAVERFGNFYSKGYSTEQYLNRLPEYTAGSPEGFHGGAPQPAGMGTSGEPDLSLRFGTTESGIIDSSALVRNHSTAAQFMRRDGDLWILRVTVPENRTPWGGELFQAVLPSFTPNT